MKSNIHKKLTFEDRFARHYYCKGAALRSIRADKRFNKRKLRRIDKAACMEGERENYETRTD